MATATHRLVVDTSIWTKAFKAINGEIEEGGQEAASLVEGAIAGRWQPILPANVVTEIVSAGGPALAKLWQRNPTLVALWKEETAELAKCFSERLLEHVLRNFPMVPFDKNFAYRAGICARIFDLSGMDALVAYTAIESQVPLVSSDSAHLAIPTRLNGIEAKSQGEAYELEIVEKARSITILNIKDYPWTDVFGGTAHA